MHIGMLWYDNEPKVTLQKRIERAVDYYRRKYHQEPNLCLIGRGFESEQLKAKLTCIGDLHIRVFDPVLPSHLWIGIEDGAD